MSEIKETFEKKEKNIALQKRGWFMKALKIGDKIAKVPIIQGGMGVGVSRSKLAGAVAREGGIGIISTAQIGYDEAEFEQDPAAANRKAIGKHIRLAKEKAAGGLVGVNIMVALRDYADHVKAAVEAGADVIISGAGIPAKLPEYVINSDTKIAPIVSSAKAAKVLLQRWEKKYQRTADFVVIEGPKAGGHLGFSGEELQAIDKMDYDTRIREIICTVREFADRFQQKIPVIVAGGIFTAKDVKHAVELGADGVQVASRFVVTKECDASQAYKDAYIQGTTDEVEIIKSPVGMPGRALHNQFLEKVQKGRIPVKKCYGCMRQCNINEIPYCITDALTKAVRGDVKNGLIFCGAEVGRIHEMTTVHDLMEELEVGFE